MTQSPVAEEQRSHAFAIGDSVEILAGYGLNRKGRTGTVEEIAKQADVVVIVRLHDLCGLPEDHPSILAFDHYQLRRACFATPEQPNAPPPAPRGLDGDPSHHCQVDAVRNVLAAHATRSIPADDYHQVKP